MFSGCSSACACVCVHVRGRSVVLKKKWGTPETRLRQRFFKQLYTGTLIHVRKIATADL